MNVIAAIIATAFLCVGSYFWGGHEKGKELEAIRAAMREETTRALHDVKGEVARVEMEYNKKIESAQIKWTAEIAPLLDKAKAKCREGSTTTFCQQANNAVLVTIFGLK
ncbi:hypothetical protein LNV23_00720 [Paucibacter sp. DJ1R-11]|uniref:hypothetical protein n=1 Tax=Paucibacter sp. DJ1R-11 TaxID=2893556 RepID=UPI0021E450CF|nr:hypothetical protein [Paucibacter sp. DJ1R-11]MCV2361967.1 hypothetical protein [Paucibacter sp. DJ1R-11]